MKVLITGSAGFIGRHFYEYLRGGDNQITCLDPKHFNPYDTDVYGNALDYFRVNQERFDLVIHCAAVVGGRETIEGEPLRLAAANLQLDAALFDWALRARPGRIIYFSSSAVYPIGLQSYATQRQLVEDDIKRVFIVTPPDQTYGWAKLTGEMLAAHANQAGIPTYVFRPFSGYGSDQDDTYPFPAFIDRALRREDPFTIWGDEKTVRDWIHVDDIVRAVMTAVEITEPGVPVNLGSGFPITMHQLAQAICVEAGYAPEFKVDTSKPRGVAYRVAAIDKMRQFYQPRISLTEGIRRALEDRA